LHERISETSNSISYQKLSELWHVVSKVFDINGSLEDGDYAASATAGLENLTDISEPQVAHLEHKGR